MQKFKLMDLWLFFPLKIKGAFGLDLYNEAPAADKCAVCVFI